MSVSEHKVMCLGCHKKNAELCVPFSLCPGCKLITHRYLEAHRLYDQLYEAHDSDIKEHPEDREEYIPLMKEAEIFAEINEGSPRAEELISELKRRGQEILG